MACCKATGTVYVTMVGDVGTVGKCVFKDLSPEQNSNLFSTLLNDAGVV